MNKTHSKNKLAVLITVLAFAFLLCLAANAFAVEPAEKPKDLSLHDVFGHTWILAAASFLLWYFFGKERRIFPTTDSSLPEGLTPIDARYIMYGYISFVNEMRNKSSILTATHIVSWASKGCLHISEITKKGFFSTKRGLLLRKLRNLGEEAKPYERELFDSMFSREKGQNADQVTIFNGVIATGLKKYYTLAHKVRNAYRDVITSIYNERRMIMMRRLLWAPALIMVAIMFYFKSYFQQWKPQGGDSLFKAGNFSGYVVIIVAFFLFYARLTLLEPSGELNQKVITKLGTTYILLRALLALTGVSQSMDLFSLLGLCTIDTSFLPLILSDACERRTELGLKYMARLTKFKSSMETAEPGRIYGMENKNQQYFYDMLPYAIALGVAGKWAKKFERAALKPPDWYESSATEGTFNAVSFVFELKKRLRGRSWGSF